MNYVIITLVYGAIFYGVGFGGYQLYKVINNKIKEAQTGWQLAAFSVLLFVMCAVLLVGGLYAFIEIYRLLSGL